MKKLCILMLALASAASALALAACQKDEKVETSDYVISDFESDAEYLTMLWENYFGKVDENEDPAYIVSGERSARLEVHGYKKDNLTPAVTMYTDTAFNGKVDYTDTLYFEISVYNTMSVDVPIDFTFYSNSMETGKNGWYPTQSLTAKPKQWNTFKIDIDRIDLSKNWGLDKISKFKFTFLDYSDADPAVLYFDQFIAHTTNMAIPEFEMEETHEVKKVGESYAVASMDATVRRVYKDGALREDLASASSIALEKGVYQIDYIKSFEDGSSSRVKTVYVHAENAQLVDIKAADCKEEPERAGTLFAGLSDDTDYAIFEGRTALKMSGARDPDQPYGFTWNTGVTETIKSIVLYVYNARDVNVRMWSQYAWPILPEGTFFDLAAKEWTRVELTGDFNEYANGWATGSPVKRDPTTGEWQLFIPIQIWDTHYEVYLHALIETESGSDYVYVPLEEKLRYAAAGNEVTVEEVEGATWIIKKNGEEVASLANAKKFTAEAGEYTIEYTKRKGEAVGTASCTIYAEDVANGWLNVAEEDFGGPVEGVDIAGLAAPGSMEIGGTQKLFGKDLIHIAGTTSSPDIVANIRTGLSGTPSKVTYYIYNASAGQVRARFNADANMFDMQPQSWTRFGVDGETFIWYVENHGTTGAKLANGWKDGEEWILRFPFRVAEVIEYDLYLAVFFEGEFAPVEEPTAEIELETTEKFVAAGDEVTVEEVEGATWIVKKNGEEVTSLANAKKFTAEAGTYTVEYTKQVGDETGRATCTVHAEDVANGWLNVAEENLSGPVEGVDIAGLAAPDAIGIGGTQKLFGKDLIHITGTTSSSDIVANIRTGLSGTPSNVTYYVYNASAGPVNGRFNADANIFEMQSGTWIRFEVKGDTFIWYAENHGATGAKLANGWKDGEEWILRFPFQVVKVAEYDLYLAVFFEGDFTPVEAGGEISGNETKVIAPGVAYTVTAYPGTTWTVKKNGTADESLTNGFTPEKGDCYVVEYSKDGQIVKTDTLYCEAGSIATIAASDCRNDEERSGRIEASGANASEHALGEGQSLRMTAAQDGDKQAGLTWDTGLTGEVDSIVFYIYNDRDVVVTFYYGDNMSINIPAKSQIRIELAGSQFETWNGNWNGATHSQLYRDEDGSWCVYFQVQFWDSNVDLYINAFVATK